MTQTPLFSASMFRCASVMRAIHTLKAFSPRILVRITKAGWTLQATDVREQACTMCCIESSRFQRYEFHAADEHLEYIIQGTELCRHMDSFRDDTRYYIDFSAFNTQCIHVGVVYAVGARKDRKKKSNQQRRKAKENQGELPHASVSSSTTPVKSDEYIKNRDEDKDWQSAAAYTRHTSSSATSSSSSSCPWSQRYDFSLYTQSSVIVPRPTFQHLEAYMSAHKDQMVHIDMEANTLAVILREESIISDRLWWMLDADTSQIACWAPGKRRGADLLRVSGIHSYSPIQSPTFMRYTSMSSPSPPSVVVPGGVGRVHSHELILKYDADKIPARMDPFPLCADVEIAECYPIRLMSMFSHMLCSPSRVCVSFAPQSPLILTVNSPHIRFCTHIMPFSPDESG